MINRKKNKSTININKLKHIISYIPGTVWLYQSLFGKSESIKVPRFNLNRGKPPQHDFVRIKRKYLNSPIASEADTFVLYRIIGNDLYPRHRKGQSRDNLKFILENEPAFAACEKRFVVNRIIDRDEEASILKLLDQSGYSYIHIPFILDEYLNLSWDIKGVPEKFAPYSTTYSKLSPPDRGRLTMRLFRHKNNYAMNNNGARNAALNEGRSLAKWVLPWDGNCFITVNAWSEIVSTIKNFPETPYFITPMARVTNNLKLLDSTYKPQANEEPQIIFRKDAGLCFNEDFFYGCRPKVELLWRLNVPGNWDQWKIEPWDIGGTKYAEEAGLFRYAGWVARLDSGQQHLEVDPNHGKTNRGRARNQAIASVLDYLDSKVFQTKDFSKTMILRHDYRQAESEHSINKLHEILLLNAQNALGRGPYSVTDKTTLPPSNDPHDYWHPAPYYWPNPLRPSGMPYINRDGQRIPGTKLYDPESDKYDRTRLQRLFDDTTMLAMAWKFFHDKRFAEHGASLIKTWFLNPDTKMNPNLNYAQVRMGHDRNMGSNWGIIEMKDLYFFLDAVRIIQNDGFLSSQEQNMLKEWLAEYLQWLRTSPQGTKERSSKNNHGLYYDLQVASIACFLEEHILVRDTLRDSRFRILEHFKSDGSQPHELNRTTTAHYCCFNLQGWIHLALLAEFCGEDLWNFEGKEGQSIKKAMHWLLAHMGKEWPYQQIDEFDHERFYPIYYACKTKYGLSGEIENLYVPDPLKIKPIFFPHDGIRPFWQLGIK